MTSTRHANLTRPQKRYQNRKQQLRRDAQAGRITPDQRQALQAEAYAEYVASTRNPGADVYGETVAAARLWLDKHGVGALPAAEHWHSHRCDESCIAARNMSKCQCACNGANHGIARGTPLGTPADRALSYIAKAARRGEDGRVRQWADYAIRHGAQPAAVEQAVADGLAAAEHRRARARVPRLIG